MYVEDFSCVAEKSKILVKEKGKKFFTYKTVSKIAKLLADEGELYTLDCNIELNRITKIEYIGVQEFYEIKTFSGGLIHIGKDTDIFVDGVWIPMYELLFHEKIYLYDILDDTFRNTYVTSIELYKNLRAVKIYAEKEDGIVVNNFMIRFFDSVETVAPIP